MKKIAFTATCENGRTFLYDRYISFIEKYAKKHDVLCLILPITADEQKISEYARLFDGFVFTGGDDISPNLFVEKTHEKCGNIDKMRDIFEIMLCREALRLNKPVFGICRGVQIIAVALGGTLIQDIPSEIGCEIIHSRQMPNDKPSHSVHLSGKLFDIIEECEIEVNSYHHQAVRAVPPQLDICAISSDGIIEAIAYKTHKFCLGVQWHPEIDPNRHSLKLADAFLCSI